MATAQSRPQIKVWIPHFVILCSDTSAPLQPRGFKDSGRSIPVANVARSVTEVRRPEFGL